jgi:malate dehydrogenase (oxaloacetate-decarboxylating)(NADP+)
MFTRPVLEAMARNHQTPIIFALSNPTAKQECTAEEAYAWTEGRAVFASGSPSPAQEVRGERRVPGQGNNAYIFPGVGLAAVAFGITRITDRMFLAAARALAGEVADSDLARGTVYPPLERIREVSAAIAAAVGEVAYEQGLASEPQPKDWMARIRSCVFEPEYRKEV